MALRGAGGVVSMWTVVLLGLVVVAQTLVISWLMVHGGHSADNAPEMKGNGRIGARDASARDVTIEAGRGASVGSSTAVEEQVGDHSDQDRKALLYLFHKFRQAAAQVKRMVLQRKHGNRVDVDVGVAGMEAVLGRRYLLPEALRVATYNIWHTNAPWEKRLEAMGGELRRVKVDVLGLQEVRQVDGESQAHVLLRRVAAHMFHVVYTPVMNQGQADEEGLAILSRFPFVWHKTVELVPENKQVAGHTLGLRKVLHALVDVGGALGRVHVLNTHLAIFDVEQCVSVRQLAEYVFSLGDEHPVVLVGDFNAYFDFEWPMDWLTDMHNPFFATALNPCRQQVLRFAQTRQQEEKNGTKGGQLHDAWRWVYPLEDLQTQKEGWWSVPPALPGYTFSNFDRERMEDSSRPDRVLWYDGQERMVQMDVGLFGQQELEGEENVYASDHRGVLAVFGIDATGGRGRKSDQERRRVALGWMEVEASRRGGAR